LELLHSTTVYRTDLQGAIDLHTDGSRLWVTSER
jgi:beta-lactamase superfamily II metal-dependent hydrolase